MRSKVTRRAWMDADAQTAEEAADLYGVPAPARAPVGMEFIGWTWEHSDGFWGIVKAGTSIRSRYQPVAMRRVYVERSKR